MFVTIVVCDKINKASQSSTPSEHFIVLTKNGFIPKETTIIEGDTVTFSTSLEDPFWPASSEHPTHTIYPEFDSKHRIFPPETWSFTFNKVGRWQYHDHLSANFRGYITTLSRDKNVLSKVISTDCTVLSGTQKIQCMSQRLDEILIKRGVTEGFDYFVEVYRDNPEVSDICHDWAHLLGEADYENYRQGKDIDFRPEAAYCSYGYFHGFVAALVDNTQTLDDALIFCNLVDKKFGSELRRIRSNCVHGIGHGIFSVVVDQSENWGDFIKMVRSGVFLCEKISADQTDQSNCTDGMFHELVNSMRQSEYGMDYEAFRKTDDIFYYCNQIIGESGTLFCYQEFVVLWPDFFNDDKKAIARYLPSHLAHLSEHGSDVLYTVARSWIALDLATNDYAESIDACRLMPDNLKDTCMRGMTIGFIEHTETNKQYIKGFEFCRNDLLNKTEHTACFTHMTDLLWNQYDLAHFKMACDSLSSEEKTGQCLQV